MTTNRNTSNTTRTRIRQQQENEQQQNQEQQYQNSEQSEHYYYYNNYNNARVHAREAGALPSETVMQMIAEAYRANISDKITKAAASIIEDALTHGMEPDTVILAIEETGLASRPSPYYLRAVLRNWAENGVVVSRVSDLIQTTQGAPWWK